MDAHSYFAHEVICQLIFLGDMLQDKWHNRYFMRTEVKYKHFCTPCLKIQANKRTCIFFFISIGMLVGYQSPTPDWSGCLHLKVLLWWAWYVGLNLWNHEKSVLHKHYLVSAINIHINIIYTCLILLCRVVQCFTSRNVIDYSRIHISWLLVGVLWSSHVQPGSFISIKLVICRILMPTD